MAKLKKHVVDGGNTKWKTETPGARDAGRIKDEFPHYFVKLSDQDVKRIKARADESAEHLFCVNGSWYMIGERAARYGQFTRQYGEKRFTRLYYGVLAAISMARGFGETTKNIFYMGGFPPGDVDYVDDLMASVVTSPDEPWNVEWMGNKIVLDVVDATVFDEPLGGWANRVLRKDGKGYAKNIINDGVTLILDVGGYTTDGLVIDPGGDPDYTSARSIELGVLKSVEQFARDFKSENRLKLKGATLNDAMIHEAIRTGQYNARGLGVIDCQQLAIELRRELAGQVVNFFDGYGGSSEYDHVIFTGGGAALIEAELRSGIIHNSVHMAHDKSDLQHRANVEGAVKWLNLQMALGTYD